MSVHCEQHMNLPTQSIHLHAIPHKLHTTFSILGATRGCHPICTILLPVVCIQHKECGEKRSGITLNILIIDFASTKANTVMENKIGKANSMFATKTADTAETRERE